ncbi:MAG: hypothetical protein U5S82_14195 [Gammaproteobacteria bacterium]|nr:hypothetical protein [Gammaproteobacteria bacterium]
MASMYRGGSAWLGDRGVVIIDGDQSMVRLVRAPGREAAEDDPDLCERMARNILKGYLHITEQG